MASVIESPTAAKATGFDVALDVTGAIGGVAEQPTEEAIAADAAITNKKQWKRMDTPELEFKYQPSLLRRGLHTHFSVNAFIDLYSVPNTLNIFLLLDQF